jgi:hypothetical protein
MRTVAVVILLSLALPAARQSRAQQRGVGVQIKVSDGRLVSLYGKSYALVVGVSDYTSGWPRLPGVKTDIEEISRTLERHGFQVTKVENPDSAQLDKSFREFIDAYGQSPDGRLLFYFAGHGHTVRRSFGEEMGYIVPADAPNPNADRSGFLAKAMSMEQVELYAKRIEAKHALFLFDSCFSGALFDITRAVPENISYQTARPVRQFITSGSADERVPDKSIFRAQFVSALEGEADRDKDGYVTGTELGMFLQDKVIIYSRNSQHPQYGKIRNPNLDKGDFVFQLPRGAAPAGEAAHPSPTTEKPAGPQAVDPATLELAFWDAIKNSSDPNDYRAYLDKYPEGTFAPLAKYRAKLDAAKAPSAGAGPAGLKKVGPKVLWISHSDPRKVSWNIQRGPNDLPALSDFLQSVSDAGATISFRPFAELGASRAQGDYDVFILLTSSKEEFDAAHQLIREGKGVLVLADYFMFGSNQSYADIASSSFTEKYGMKIQRDDYFKDHYQERLWLKAGSHPVASGVVDMFKTGHRGEHIILSGAARPILLRGDGQTWAAAWDGKSSGLGRVLVVPDTTFFWSNSVRERGRDHNRFWSQALSWLAGN